MQEVMGLQNKKNKPLSPGRKWSRGDSISVKKMRCGLNIEYIGIVTSAVSILIIILFNILATTGYFPPVLIVIALGVYNLGAMLMLLGPVVSLAVPVEVEARKILILAIVCQLGNVGCTIGESLFARFLFTPLNLFLHACGCFGLILFIIYLKKMAIFCKQKPLVSETKEVLDFVLRMLGILFLTWLLEVINIFPELFLVFFPIGMIVVLVTCARLISKFQAMIAPRP